MTPATRPKLAVRPSLNRLGPVPRLGAAAGDASQRRGVLGALARQQQGLAPARRAVRRRAMQVQVSLDLTAFLGQEHRKQKAGAKALTEPRQQAGSATGLERFRRPAVLGQQLAPDLNVAILDGRQFLVDVALVLVRFGAGQDAVQIGRVGLVLPVMFECFQVRGHAEI
jgi:hypothetical protein